MSKRIIKEARGIAESAIPYTHAVLDKIKPELDYFFEHVNDPSYLESMEDIRVDGYAPAPDHVVTLKFPYRTLAKYIDDDIFEDFPIVNLTVEVKFAFVDSESPNDDTFSIGGAMWPIHTSALPTDHIFSSRVKPEKFPAISKSRRESVDRGLIGNLEFDLTFYQGFDFTDPPVEFERELNSVVFHEMMHLYEGYKNKKLDLRVFNKDFKETGPSKKQRSHQQTAKAYIGDAKFVGIPSEVKQAIQYLTNYYYMTLPQEVKAITHEMYPYVLDLPIDEFFKTYQGKRIKSLMAFNTEDYMEHLDEEIESYFDRIGKRNVSPEVKNNMLNQLKMRMIAKYRETANRNHEVIDHKLINQKDLKSLVNYMGKQINNAGNKLYRNLGRLYSLKMDVNE